MRSTIFLNTKALRNKMLVFFRVSYLSKGLGPAVWPVPQDLWLLLSLFISLSPLYSHLPHAGPPVPVPKPFGQIPDP